MKSRIYLTLVAICLALSLNTLAQDKEITRDEYFGPWREALQKGRTLSRRKVSKTEMFKDGKVSATDESTYEYVLPDRIRYIHIETEGDRVRRTEEISIGKTKYCRRENGPWENRSCIGGGVGGISNTISFRYSVETVKLNNENVKLFRQYITYKDNYSKNKDTEGLSFYETNYWLNKDGLFIREEFRYGLVDSKKLKRITVDIYEYNPKDLKIEAPKMN